ncbi:hypothetical protein B7P43_G17318 [Cryptotermes secundus]|uniref:Uncharacterized protein n=1 Tax=Cryptotermes secundus TaxID=105785 RepID=A0A2J7Q1B7_9NEOP|nr:hypothetical protein B7P43_G17318 [Cryptotermes secundus]
MNYVSTAVNCDYATLMDDQQLPYVHAPGLEITSILRENPDVATLIEFVQLELPKCDFFV